MKKYKFENAAATWWAEYQVDGMANQDNITILGIRSMSVGGTINHTDIDDVMVAMGLPNHTGTRITHVDLVNLATTLNLTLTSFFEQEAGVVKYTALLVQATPTFSPVAGAVAGGATITIASSGADKIYYTKDGSIPTAASTDQSVTPCVTNASGATIIKAIAFKAGKYKSLIGEAAYTQAVAAAPTNVVLAVGSTAPVGGVTNVAIPAAGATDDTGKVTGWAATTADKIKITVTNAASTASTLTINGAAYNSGADYQIAEVGTLTVVLTTTRANYVTSVRTFTIDVAAA